MLYQVISRSYSYKFRFHFKTPFTLERKFRIRWSIRIHYFSSIRIREAFTLHSLHDTAMVNIKYSFKPLSDIMRCFDPVWRLNLTAMNLKNIYTGITWFGFFTESRLHESFLWILMFLHGYEVPTNFSRFKVSGHGTKPRRFTIRFIATCLSLMILLISQCSLEIYKNTFFRARSS
jgi:hypothetical protein